MTDHDRAPSQVALIIGDLLRAALDDERVRLTPMVERRVIRRMVELAEVAGYHIEQHQEDP